MSNELADKEQVVKQVASDLQERLGVSPVELRILLQIFFRPEIQIFKLVFRQLASESFAFRNCLPQDGLRFHRLSHRRG